MGRDDESLWVSLIVGSRGSVWFCLAGDDAALLVPETGLACQGA